LLAKDNHGRTILHEVKFHSNVEILEKVYMWAKEQLTSKEINKLLLAQDRYRQTALHMAAWGGQYIRI
jgi:ankyrin repeat protein